MRHRTRVSYAAVACACAGGAGALGSLGIVSCVGDNGAGPDASFPDVNEPDTYVPPFDAGPVPEAAADVPVIPIVDSSPGAPDAADAADATPPCGPGSVAGFTPPPYVHASTQSFFCQIADVNALAESCAGDASTYELCANFPNEALVWGESSQCTTCLLTPEITLPPLGDAGGLPDAGDDAGDASDDGSVVPPVPTYGAAIVSRVTLPNVAGCIELNDPTDGGVACAIAVQAAWRCEEFACNPTCPVTDNPSALAYLACAEEAATGVCASYASVAAGCLATEADAGGLAYSACLSPVLQNLAGPAPGPAATFADIATLFCGS
jgi:hypothetical protein